jgi:predicted SAM-dependent methyltransferase
MASHVLEHIDRDQVLQAVRNLAEAVKVGGEFWIMVPSMEWAALQIRKSNNSPVVQLVIFGRQAGPHDYHKAGFTLMELRQLMEMIGFATRKAYQSPLGIGWNDKVYDALQDIVIGYRYQ